MTPRQKALVQESFAWLEPMAETVATLFYARLFALDPSLRPLFRGDMTVQGRHLMDALALAVRSLDRLDALVPSLEALGRRHVAYGVRNQDYATVGAALLWTLEQGLGERLTPELTGAWAAAYGLLATTMQDAGRLAA